MNYGVVAASASIEGMIALLSGAKQGLSSLKAKGFELVAATNGYDAYQWPVLKALGVDDYFSSVLTPDRVGFAKPDPRLFAGTTNLRAHVGDPLVQDVLAANAAQITSIWLNSQLPEEILALNIEDRTTSDIFLEDFGTYWERALHRTYHPEATLELCWPAVVVIDVSEAATFIIDRFT